TRVEGESLFGEVVTEIEAEKNAASLLAKSLEMLPAGLLTAEVVDKKPTILAKNESRIKAAWTITISYNNQDYFQKTLPRLQKVFEAIAIHKSGSLITVKPY